MATIEIDGKTVETENGKMIIEVADELGIHIPRFCYHKKLSVAANCRMCLVQVENNRKTVPACATPITHGMKVFTKSKEAIQSQEAVMDFLLINHPLDCPICDQGGECELQDVSMGFGADHSTYEETKRAVTDDNLGTLIETEMTRCIHCTRCIRFGDEIAGVRELCATNRGENVQIGTYVQHSMTSEVSANIIDLCPVGALTSKPYRYTARAWEMTQHDGIAAHDCLGSAIYLHTRRDELMRVVPKEAEDINETWLSDRDRFSYLGLKSKARLDAPMIKRNGVWETVDWKTALTFAADGLAHVIKHHGPEEVAAFASPSATLEELYLLQKWMRGLGVHNLDHRLQQTDFRDQECVPVYAKNKQPYATVSLQETILLFGTNISREVPLAGLRVRKAFRNGAQIYAINPVDYAFPFALTEKVIASPCDISMQLAMLLLALVDDVAQLPYEMQALLVGVKPSATIRLMAAALRRPNGMIVTGALAENHPHAAIIRLLLASIETLTDVTVLRLTTGANSAGAALAGMLPHRAAGGKLIEPAGLDTQRALEAKLKAYFLFGVDPGADFSNPYGTRQSMLAAEFVVVCSAFKEEAMYDYAHVILPIAPYPETSGTYINIDQTWQSVKGAVPPFANARPGWKILRVLANLFDVSGFDYASSQDVLREIEDIASMMMPQSYIPFYQAPLPVATDPLVRVGEWPLYRCDAVVRHAEELQMCGASEVAHIRVHPDLAAHLQLELAATVSQGHIEITLPLVVDERVARDVVWVANAMPETVDLGHAFAAITIKPQ